MKKSDNEVDVRNLSSQEKESAVIDSFLELNEGESVTIIIDENPRPLKFQIATNHADHKFTWEYLEEGPDIWKVRIAKLS